MIREFIRSYEGKSGDKEELQVDLIDLTVSVRTWFPSASQFYILLCQIHTKADSFYILR